MFVRNYLQIFYLDILKAAPALQCREPNLPLPPPAPQQPWVMRTPDLTSFLPNRQLQPHRADAASVPHCGEIQNMDQSASHMISMGTN